MGAKLTKAQRRELIEMAGRTYRSHYSDGYKPIVALFEQGYVEREKGQYGNSTYFITPAGRAALSKASPSEEGEA